MKDFSASYITKAVEKSLRRLATDYIDVYFLHTPRGDEQFKECLNTFNILEKMRSEGKIRIYGISVDHEDRGIEMIRSDMGQVIQVIHNILTPGPEHELFPLAEKNGVGIIARVPLASGFLTGKFTHETRFGKDDQRNIAYPPDKIIETVDIVDHLRFLQDEGQRTMAQAALQYVLSMTAVSSVIPGAKNIRQARENARSSDLGPLFEEELVRIRELISLTGR